MIKEDVSEGMDGLADAFIRIIQNTRFQEDCVTGTAVTAGEKASGLQLVAHE